MELFTLLLIIIVGVFIGIISVTSGSSSLITIPFLMSLGLDPQVAIATNRFSILSSFISGGIKYRKLGLIKYRKWIIGLSLITLIGSLIGVSILLKIDKSILKLITIILLVISLVIVIASDYFSSTTKNKNNKAKLNFLNIFFTFALGIYSGFFGTGFGTFTILSMVYLYGFSFLESTAIMTVLNFFAIISSVLIFAYQGIIDYSFGIPLFLSIAVGGYIGASFAITKGNVWIKKLFIIVASILIIKLILSL